MDINYAVIPVRPAGGAWSSVRDMLKYVQVRLDGGTLPDGTRYIPKDTLLARRTPQVSIGQDVTYGMGLMADTKYGTTVVHHGGDLIGYHSDMMWLPEHNVGAVILTNVDPGWSLRGPFGRKLLEVLFDGRPEAEADVAAQGKSYLEQLAAERKLMTVPASPADVEEAGLALYKRRARRYHDLPPSRGNHLPLRGVEKRDGVPPQSGRHAVVLDRCPRHHRTRVRRGSGTGADAHRARRAARVRVRGGRRTNVVEVTRQSGAGSCLIDLGARRAAAAGPHVMCFDIPADGAPTDCVLPSQASGSS